MTSVTDATAPDTAPSGASGASGAAPGGTSTDVADTHTPRHGAGAPAWRRRLLVGAVFVVATLAMMRPNPATFSTNVPGNLGDGVLIAALMEWDAHALANGENPFYANYYWPEPLTLAYTESMLTLTPVYMTFRLLGASWAAALNLTLLAQIGLSLVATYLLCRRLTGRTDAAVIGALAYTFGSFLLAHAAVGHLQLGMLGMLPLAYLCVLNVFERRRGWPWAIGLGVSFVVLVGSALYLAAILAVALVVVVAGRIVTGPRSLRPAQFGNLVLAGVIALGFSAPMLLPYTELRSDDFSRPLSDEFALDHEDLLAPAYGNYLFAALGISGRLPELDHEHRRFPGVVPVLLAVVGVVVTVGAALRRRRRGPPAPDAAAAASADRGPLAPRDARRWLLLFGAAGVVLVSLAFGPSILNVKGPYAYLYETVPGFDGMRGTSRFAIGLLLATALFAAAGWAWIAARLSTRLGRVGVAAVTAVVAALILVEQASPIPSAPLDVSDGRLAVYRAMADVPDGVAVELPIVVPPDDPYDWAYVEAPRMLYDTIGMNRRVNGYSGYYSPEYPDRARLINTFPARDAVDELRRLGVRFVVLHTGEAAGFRQYTNSEAQLIVGALPDGATATRHGDSWLVDLAGGR